MNKFRVNVLHSLDMHSHEHEIYNIFFNNNRETNEYFPTGD